MFENRMCNKVYDMQAHSSFHALVDQKSTTSIMTVIKLNLLQMKKRYRSLIVGRHRVASPYQGNGQVTCQPRRDVRIQAFVLVVNESPSMTVLTLMNLVKVNGRLTITKHISTSLLN
jgi:hypothetical protein